MVFGLSLALHKNWTSWAILRDTEVISIFNGCVILWFTDGAEKAADKFACCLCRSS